MSFLGPIVMFFGVLIVLFFITRMFWLWYFKLDKIEEHLAAIRRALAPGPETPKASTPEPPSSSTT